MRRRQAKGQILVLIVVVLLGLIVIFALLSRTSVRVRTAPIVREALWTVGGSAVTTVAVGEEVEARVVIEAVEEYVGSVVVKIRKDISFWLDSDHHISTVLVNLRGGEQEEIKIAFTPDEAGGGGVAGLRGYFIEIGFKVTQTSWVMENSYPPRLRVTE